MLFGRHIFASVLCLALPAVAAAEADEAVAIADRAWKGYEKLLAKKAKSIDPIDAVRHARQWKGKTIRIDDFVDEAGSGFASADYDLIAVVNGSAVAMKYTRELRSALTEFEERGYSIESIHQESENGYTITSAARIETVVGKVLGTCRVTVKDSIDGTSYTAGTYEAPLVEVIALKQGPIAISAGQKSVAELLAKK